MFGEEAAVTVLKLKDFHFPLDVLVIQKDFQERIKQTKTSDSYFKIVALKKFCSICMKWTTAV